MSAVEQIVCSPVEQSGTGELLLELLSEEVPARMQARAIADLEGLLRDQLAAADLPPRSVRGYATPRRLAVVADGIPAAQPARSDERRGPRVGAAQPAIDGFLRSAGLGSITECEIRDTGRGEFYFAVVRHPGRPAAAVLPAAVAAAIALLSWPKSMRWPGSSLRWVRPLRSVVCLYDGEVVPLALDGVPVGRTTRGHRLLAPASIVVRSAAEYLERLQHARVMIDHRQRRETIATGLGRRAAELGLAVEPDPALLDEVTGLAEFPVVLAGAIDPDFMHLPREVLTAAMRTHQKYFSCIGPDGSAAPHFLFVADNLAEDGGAAIVAGNERVLRARLADARFFWDQDRRIRLADRVAVLKERVYHDRLGSVYDKAARIEELAGFLAPRIAGADIARARRAARLAKADLSTGMVGEFPELQGIMGRYYALHDGEAAAVADAIAEHYRPLGPNDTCPTAPDSIVVALADRIDTLCGFFGINEKPSGSRDPFALRRAALGVIRLILENRLRLPLAEAFRRSPAAAGSPGFIEPTEDLLAFVAERLKVHLREAGVRHDLIAAAFARPGKGEDDIVRLLARVDALRKFLASEDGANLLVAYRRAANIVAIEERRDAVRHDGPVDPKRFRALQERTLYRRLAGLQASLHALLAGEQLDQAMAELATLRRPVDEFFADVTVNTKEPELRENRLRLLSRIRDTMNEIADFSQIEG